MNEYTNDIISVVVVISLKSYCLNISIIMVNLNKKTINKTNKQQTIKKKISLPSKIQGKGC